MNKELESYIIERIGKNAYVIRDNKVCMRTIEEGRVTHRLNTGSPDYGKFLDPIVEFKLRGDNFWIKESNMFLSKQEIVNSIE